MPHPRPPAACCGATGRRRAGSRRLTIAGLAGLLAGWALGALGVCPIVKRIWTPSWILFSGGRCFLLLAAWCAALDVLGWRGWAFPLIIIGTNSIAACLMSWRVGDSSPRA